MEEMTLCDNCRRYVAWEEADVRLPVGPGGTARIYCPACGWEEPPAEWALIPEAGAWALPLPELPRWHYCGDPNEVCDDCDPLR
jgi:hypothetical protein